ncbi:hypothetical protein SAMN04487905_112191 [Actinopolyspora xinjiangensis]|uniref:Uncharacterized protein n=1 Tax=Actinopolyspora xinjiangensis TaxID=405564 RepID=A0A1H0WJX5_9ACTN|nr:hypothetical protein [Actinopolyspora xinjiangensis]SDP90897.1 hypothetical protein SAMN04487905_112191 [Actinopolyspora xinjiangensis]
MSDTAQTLTMQDIADLARVRRPVVSMWRKRPIARGEAIPFPSPVRVVSGVEHFDRTAIVDWLQRTGRGNNSEADLDAPALSAPDDAELEELVTLLCLATETGVELAETTTQDRHKLATNLDPQDEFLRREVEAMTPSPATVRFIDDLIEASFGAAEALDRLEHGRVGRAIGVRDLTAEAIDLVRHITASCGLHLDTEGTPLVHAGEATQLTLKLAADFNHVVVTSDRSQQRALRRRATIRGIATTSEPTSPHVRILSTVGAEPRRALDAVDELIIDLAASELAVILGPAAVLCDDLPGELEQNRSQTLRSGNLVLALRLPRGLWQEAHRQPLGLWVCAGGVSRDRPLVADLAAVGDNELDAGDLVADVTGALESERARAYRYLRPHDLTQILSSRLPVVPRGIRALQLATKAVKEHLARINAATLVTGEPVPPFDVLADAAPGSRLVRRHSLGELSDRKQLVVKRGSRIDRAHAHPAGSVPVVSASVGGELFALDPLDTVRLYPRAARTEPGDVVFTERPRPAAFVDDVGGSMVASPSRILRIKPGTGIGPHATAAIINRRSDGTAEWRTWNVPIVDAELIEQLEHALTAATQYETRLRKHLAAVDDLVSAMIDGVAAGAVTLTVPRKE